MDEVKKINRFPAGIVTPPPSKSLCHRAVVCAALAGGESVIENFGPSEDLDATIAGVRALCSVGVQFDDETDKAGKTTKTLRTIVGCPDALDQLRIDCSESGSTLRFLLPTAALGEQPAVFVGGGRLLSRPLNVYERIFTEAGAFFTQEAGRVAVRGPLKSGSYSLPGDVSSQFVSGLLLALPLLDGDSELRLTTPLESRRYVDMTIDVMRRFGVRVESGDSLYTISGGQRYRSTSYRVEADYSQAAFFLAASALGRDVEVSGLAPDSLQGDSAILRVLREMGAEILWRDGTISVRAGRLRAVTVDAREIPDLVPPIAALCCFCEGASRVVNAGRLRLKESDRLQALSTELRKLGADIEESEESLSIRGAERLRGGVVDAWGDHRIAMSMAVAAIRCDGPVSLSGWRSVNKSYPGFWLDFEGGNS